MNEIVRNDILSLLGDLVDLLHENTFDIQLLFDYSNRCIHNASIFQDHDSVQLAVIVYTLYKVSKRQSSIPKKIVSNLSRAFLHLKNYDVESYHKYMLSSIDEISKNSTLRPYINTVLEEARIKKGAKLIEHGISVAKASEIFGISQWELQNYVGKTGLNDLMTFEDNKKKLIKRILFVRDLFGVLKK